MSEEEETLSRHSTFNHKPSDMAGALRARRASWSKPGVELSAREARRSHSQSWTAANVRTTNSFEYRLWVQALARRGELREELKLQSSARITSARSSSPQTFAALASSSPACMEADDRHGHATQPRATSAQHARHKSYSASQFRAEDPEHRPPRHATTAPRQPKPSPEHMMNETESERDLLQCQKRPTTASKKTYYSVIRCRNTRALT